LYKAIRDGQLTVVEAVKWVAEHGGEHIEIVPVGFDLKQNPELIDAIKRAASEAGIEISNYAVGNNFITASEEEFAQRIADLKAHVDIAARLGVKFMRHDVASVPLEETTIHRFEQELPKLVEGCRIIADYAAQYGITTSVENHGYFIQAADRVQRLVRAVDRPNFKTTLDIGNFMCVDEDAVASVKKNLPIASFIHLKDFYWRPAWMEMGEGWFRTTAGNYLRGAITGHGDIDLRSVLRAIKAHGYDGYISIEFEGLEECREASRISLDNVRKLWDAV
jgi:sugar phosphate isomerase/epimerase